MNEAVKSFWEAEACGERYGNDQAVLRYRLEPEIPAFARFERAAGKRVLEVGVGMGADFIEWAKHADLAIGIDLTRRAASLTRQRLSDAGLLGSVVMADAEHLPFREGSFDLAYAWGVLHHSADPARAFREIHRVCVPGGRLLAMLYHRRSVFAFAAWARFGLLRGRPRTSLAHAIAHIESPGTKAYRATEIPTLIEPFINTKVRPILTCWDRRVLPGFARLLGDPMGWFILVEAERS